MLYSLWNGIVLINTAEVVEILFFIKNGRGVRNVVRVERLAYPTLTPAILALVKREEKFFLLAVLISQAIGMRF